MDIRELLDGRTGGAIGIGPGCDLREAARKLVAAHIGALVVVDDAGGLIGILSERDLAHAMAEFGAEAPAKRVGDIMTRSVLTATLDESVAEILYLMNSQGVRHIPIVEGSRPVGMVSVRDITGRWLAALEVENQRLRGAVGGRAAVIDAVAGV